MKSDKNLSVELHWQHTELPNNINYEAFDVIPDEPHQTERATSDPDDDLHH